MFVTQATLFEFVVDRLNADLIEFVDGYGDIYHLVRCTDDLGDAGEYLTVVDMQADADA